MSNTNLTEYTLSSVMCQYIKELGVEVQHVEPLPKDLKKSKLGHHQELRIDMIIVRPEALD